MHVPLRAAWKGPRVVVNTMISTQSRSLKALTFIIYMRVVAFACSHSHAAASCISEPPVCKDKTHTHTDSLHSASTPLSNACTMLRIASIVKELQEQFIPQPVFLSSLCIVIHSCIYVLLSVLYSADSYFLFAFLHLKNLCEQLSVSHRPSSCINMFRLLTSNWCVF